jgi:hypothetical protein
MLEREGNAKIKEAGVFFLDLCRNMGKLTS